MTAVDNPEGMPSGGLSADRSTAAIRVDAAPGSSKPRGRPYRNVPDTRSVSLLGVGMVIGAAIGAGVALLLAPRSGSDTRRFLTRRARKIRGRTGVWTRLGRELQRAAAAKRKQMEIEAKRRELKESGEPV